MSTYSFTGNKVSFTYQRLLQISDGGDGNPTGIIYDGFGATVTIANENINNLYTTVNNLIASGIAGSTGATGSQGWQGPIGLTGESVTGAQGAYGPTGFQGNTGSQGYQGPIGLTGVGTTGFQGDTGPQGYQGITGPQGAGGGATGFQGYQGITGPQGVGTTGLQGNTGSQGDTGPQGYQGITGPQGAGGGATGSQGETGPQGDIGFQGETGPQGDIGFQGETGPQGNTGNYSPFYFQDTAPSTSLPIGSRWLDSSTGEELVLVNDETSIQWVQPYNGGGGGAGGGGVGTQGPQGVTGTIGETGPQGNTGPQGAAGGGSSYLYTNVAFVHPDGDDGTAVIGDKGLPFQTIAGAFAALTTSSSLNAVIEVWPGTVYSASTYDYNETTPLTLSFNLTLYLKPNVRINFNGGGSKGSQTPFFTVSGNKIFKIVSDDSDSSIYISSSSANCLLTAGGSCNIYIENVSLYVYPRLGIAGINPGINLVGGGDKSPICTLKNVYYEILDANDSSETLFGFQVLNGARLNVHDCKLVFNSVNESTSKSDNYFFFIKTIGSLNIHNTQTLFYVTTDVSAAPEYGVVLIDSKTNQSATTMDNCVHWIDDNSTFINYILAANGDPFNVSLVGRSIHNYGSTDDGGATYITGVASSKGSIGLLDQYATIFQPFEQK